MRIVLCTSIIFVLIEKNCYPDWAPYRIKKSNPNIVNVQTLFQGDLISVASLFVEHFPVSMGQLVSRNYSAKQNLVLGGCMHH